MSNLYKRVEEFVIDSFNKAGRKNDVKHLERTVFWIKKLKPDADEALLVAGISHDIERAFREVDYSLIKDKGFNSKEHLINHQNKGSKIIADFLNSQKFDKNIIEKIKALVSNHEVGGDFDQNILKDADSISFFENNIDHFINKIAPKIGREKVKIKFDWMFNRIINKEAKEIALPWYKDALQKLGY